MRAPPSFLVILFLPPQLLGLCLQPGDTMTSPLQYRLVSSGDPFFMGRLSLLDLSMAHLVDVAAEFSKQILVSTNFLVLVSL
ncbi:hypothetical protein DFP72DRAFT_75507 [Ephemerocybe angulata]|uniref:Uncharacterized protein n=1 Tax=Ephemerocybe angulata TaxID=980116 RepID=A0A8H6MC83_9AGAR|nr:hypothetical protein DFP72DRAFT_75507 [Tulosesus angulatus]